jgi:hypothetical protein
LKHEPQQGGETQDQHTEARAEQGYFDTTCDQNGGHLTGRFDGLNRNNGSNDAPQHAGYGREPSPEQNRIVGLYIVTL